MIKNTSTTLLVLLVQGLLLATWGHCQTTRYVANGGSDFENLCSSAANPCATIGRAVDVAVSGDPVQVAAGIYTETLDINKSIAILGEDRENTIIQAHAHAGMAERNVIRLGGGASVEVEIADVTIRHGRAVGELDLANLPNIAGGGIFNDGVTLSVERTIVTANWSLLGGGVLQRHSSLELFDVIFSGNFAINGGGMINMQDSSSSLLNVDFYGNTTLTGGGLTNFENSYLELVNVVFSGNFTDSLGGGMGNFSGSTAIMINVLFSGNRAGDGGGGIYNHQSTMIVINGTFNANVAGFGGAIMNSESILTRLYNTIIWNNIAHNQNASSVSPSIDNQASTPEIAHSLIEHSGGSIGWNPLTGDDHGENLDADPMFVDELDPETDFLSVGGNLRLNSGSPAIDAGANELYEPGALPVDVTTDLDGQQRIVGPAVDMGAYEYQPDPNIFADRFEQ
jgi:predicted outer membrane repeat protein